MWLNENTALVGRGLRTNSDGADQVARALEEIGVTSIVVDLPHSSMHLMGSVRIVDEGIAYVRNGDLPWTGLNALRDTAYEVRFFPSEEEIVTRMAHNFVTLAPRKVLMPAGNPATEAALNNDGIETVTIDVDEIAKAAGGIGCLSAILHREAK